VANEEHAAVVDEHGLHATAARGDDEGGQPQQPVGDAVGGPAKVQHPLSLTGRVDGAGTVAGRERRVAAGSVPRTPKMTLT
jgi:hypothetical protein